MMILKNTMTTEAAPFYGLFREFYEAYAGERARLDRCETIYRGDHWFDVPRNEANEPRPVTPVIHSAIENVRADLDEYVPEAVITADSAEYSELAETLTKVIRENHLNCAYDEEYRR
ncbi:MAG: hypothetical protein J5772_04680, partial [Clostridia bacterium]|nr:hypothetical protein [Clostridia bacterium]